MSIEDTKLGITMVLTKPDCKKLGFELTMKTREAIVQVRNKLGLPEKPLRT